MGTGGSAAPLPRGSAGTLGSAGTRHSQPWQPVEVQLSARRTDVAVGVVGNNLCGTMARGVGSGYDREGMLRRQCTEAGTSDCDAAADGMLQVPEMKEHRSRQRARVSPPGFLSRAWFDTARVTRLAAKALDATARKAMFLRGGEPDPAHPLGSSTAVLRVLRDHPRSELMVP